MLKLIGVTSAMKESEITRLTDPEQDNVIRREAERLEKELRLFVSDTPPKGDLIFTVKGPFSDPLQGIIHTHTMAGWFNTDQIPTDAEAYKVHVDPTQGGNAPIVGGQA